MTPGHSSQILTTLAICVVARSASAATVNWAGHTWNVTTGGMAGDNTGSSSNVTVDANGYLHLKISQSNGKWLCAELFSADSMGFGTYQWQIDAAVDKLDKNVVLGLYPYGPIAGIGADGTNEIDIEYARWGNDAWDNGNFTVYPNSGTTVGETTFNFSLNGTYTTSTFDWTTKAIRFRTQSGFKAVGDSTETVKAWTYAPSNPSTNIPQRPMPLGMNLWLCGGCGGAPSNGQPVDVVIRRFLHRPEGAAGIRTSPSFLARSAFRLVRGRDGTRFVWDSPLATSRALTISDMTGRVEHAFVVPAGATESWSPVLGIGVHLLLDREHRIAARFVVQDPGALAP